MWDEVEQMPPRQREAFILREIRGLSYGQLADELSLSRPSVRSLLLRARVRLRRRLGDVAAGLGGAPWVQALVRLVAGGDGASPLPSATKAAAVGIGALALAGGGGFAARHPSAATPRHQAEHHRAAAHVHRVSTPATTPVARVEDRVRMADHSFSVDRSRGRDGGSRESGERSGSSGEGSGGSGHDGSGDTAAVVVPSTDGHGDSGSSGGSSSSGPGSGSSGHDSSSSSGRDGSGGGGGTSGGSTSGSDGGSGSVTTTTSSDSGSGGSGSGGLDGGSSGGSDGGGGDDGSGHG